MSGEGAVLNSRCAFLVPGGCESVHGSCVKNVRFSRSEIQPRSICGARDVPGVRGGTRHINTDAPNRGEMLIIGNDVTVSGVGLNGRQVRFWINAPKEVEVYREEVRACEGGEVTVLRSNRKR